MRILKKKDIAEIEKYYSIDINGCVKKKSTGKTMTQFSCKNGYRRVYLTVNGVRVSTSTHRLVALKYIKGKTKIKCDVNHKDGNKENNDISKSPVLVVYLQPQKR